MSWYRTYRPMQFSDLVGQQHIRTILLSALAKESAAHAYLFAGSRGTGKTSTARILGKALNCPTPSPEKEPCNDCTNCNEINEGRFVDLIEIDAASNTGVDHIRELRDKIGFSPTSGKAKVYIIDEVHMLSTGAFNALLKTLEEPPSFVYFILATTELHKVPATVQSRCQRFAFRRLSTDDIVHRLTYIASKENITTDPQALQIIAEQSAGGLRDAISLFEQQAVSGEVTLQNLSQQLGLVSSVTTEQLYQSLQQGNAEQALKILDELVAEGCSLSEFARSFLLYLRDQLLSNAHSGQENLAVLSLVEIFEQAQRKMKFAVIPQLPLEVAIIKATLARPSNTTTTQAKSESKGIFGIFTNDKKPSPEPKSPPPPTPEQNTVKPKTPPSPVQKNDETHLPSPEKKPSPEFMAPELSLSSIRSAWPNILEKLSGSLLRMSLKNAEITQFTDNTLFLQFPAMTWKEQLEKTENKQEFISAFQDIFSQHIAISTSVKGVQLEPTITEKKSAPESPSSEPTPVEMLEEIMGAKATKTL